ncbi:MAG: response regulator [Acidimicrobiales bacterium]
MSDRPLSAAVPDQARFVPFDRTTPVGILLVEDNPLDARATLNAARKLEMAGNMHAVTSGQAALDLLRSNPALRRRTGLILLDLNLPDKDGHAVLAEIRNDPILRQTPVVVLTTSDDDSDVLEAYRQGANAYVTKPADLDGWLHVIASINEFWLSVARLPRP